MEDRDLTRNPRICPSCQRRVPPSIEQCRCGYVFPAAPEVDADPESEVEPTRPWLGPVIALAAIVIAVTFYMLRSSPPIPDAAPTSAPTAAARPTAPESPPPATTAPAPGVPSPVVETPTLPVPAVASPASFEDIIGTALAAVVLIETGGGRGSGFLRRARPHPHQRARCRRHVVVTLRMSDGTARRGGSCAAHRSRHAIVRLNQPRPRSDDDDGNGERGAGGAGSDCDRVGAGDAAEQGHAGSSAPYGTRAA